MQVLRLTTLRSPWSSADQYSCGDSMPWVLTKILTNATERASVAERNVATFKADVATMAPARSLIAALRIEQLAVIAEIKRRSPSVGQIDPNIDPSRLAKAYVDGGADAISVLTEPDFFGGSMADLAAVREIVEVPVLRKDFTVSPAQIWEARAGGADAVLLIAAVLSDTALEELLEVADQVGVDAIVEAHTAQEVQRAVSAGARIVGVNNRDLATFRTDLSVAESIAGDLPEGIVAIAESGVSDERGARRMAIAGYDAILVGEALVRSDDPSLFLRTLKAQS